MATTYPIPGPWVGSVAILARPRGSDWLEDDIYALARDGFDTIVSLLTPAEVGELGLREEAQIVQRAGLAYIAFPIPDRRVPPSMAAAQQVVEQLLELLQTGHRIGIHCRQGIGRSSMIIAGMLALSGVSTEAAFTRIAAARQAPVPDTPEQRRWVEQFTQWVVVAASIG